jgi:transposase InsO family protein
VIDFIHKWGGERSGLSQLQIVGWVGIARSKFYDWRVRYGKANEHNAWIPRDHWIEGWERDEIVKFAREFPLEGYRRLTFMMLDRDIVAVSPSTTYRVLKAAGLIQTWNGKPSKKGTGFVQPLAPHEHWHVDVSHINVAGTFYYLCSLLDGCSRSIVHHELRESMTEADVEPSRWEASEIDCRQAGRSPSERVRTSQIIIQRALEKHPGAKPRIISDNGPQFIAKDFKEFVRVAGLTHVKTSPYYPQSNGKIERWHKSLKADCIRPGTPLDIEQARLECSP